MCVAQKFWKPPTTTRDRQRRCLFVPCGPPARKRTEDYDGSQVREQEGAKNAESRNPNQHLNAECSNGYSRAMGHLSFGIRVMGIDSDFGLRNSCLARTAGFIPPEEEIGRWEPRPALAVTNPCRVDIMARQVALMIYKIALQKSDEGYAASVPGLPGCWSQGETEQEALENVRVAIQEYIEVANELLDGAELREVDVNV